MKRVFLLLLLACCLLVGAAAAAGGSGTAADPYIIQTAAELQSIQNNLAAYYKLGNDIDLSGVSWTSIGSYAAPFTGSLNGNGFKIMNLNYGYGFIGAASGATISNIIIENWDSTKASNDANGGMFIGYCTGQSLTTTLRNIDIINCKYTTPYPYSGLCVGRIDTLHSVLFDDVDIINCNMRATYNTGLICGPMESATTNFATTEFINCDVKDSVLIASSYSVGGIFSKCNPGTVIISNCVVENCIISGSVTGGVGGEIGGSYGSTYSSLDMSDCVVENCIISGDVAGGLIGADYSSVNDSEISNCIVNKCTIIGTKVGGISSVRTQMLAISNCDISDCTIIGTTSAGGIYAQ